MRDMTHLHPYQRSPVNSQFVRPYDGGSGPD